MRDFTVPNILNAPIGVSQQKDVGTDIRPYKIPMYTIRFDYTIQVLIKERERIRGRMCAPKPYWSDFIKRIHVKQHSRYRTQIAAIDGALAYLRCNTKERSKQCEHSKSLI